MKVIDYEGRAELSKLIKFNFDKKYELENITAGNENFIDSILITLGNTIYKGVEGISDLLFTSKVTLDGVDAYRTKTPEIKDLVRKKNAILRIMSDKNFDPTYMYGKKTPIMQGMGVRLDELLKILDKESSYIDILISNMKSSLNRYENMASLKSKEAKKLLQSTNDLKFETKLNNDLTKDIKAIFKTNVITDVKPLQDVVGKIKNIPLITNDAIKIGSKFKHETLKEIDDLNEDLSDVIKILITNVDKSDKDFLIKLSNEIKLLADNITNIAYLFYLYYQSVDMVTAITKLITKKDKENSIIAWYKDRSESFSLENYLKENKIDID